MGTAICGISISITNPSDGTGKIRIGLRLSRTLVLRSDQSVLREDGCSQMRNSRF
jgi:hypothetical protein